MSLPSAPARSERLVFLDALRGIACLLVFVFHLFEVGDLHPVLVRQLPPFFNALTRAISPVIQYFGTISYSLYLLHMPIMILIFRVGFQITGESLAGAAAWLLLSVALSSAGAQLLFLCVERPSMNWASRFKRK